MSIGVLLRGFIGDMMDFGDVILRTLFPSFMTIQACMMADGRWQMASTAGRSIHADRSIYNIGKINRKITRKSACHMSHVTLHWCAVLLAAGGVAC
jgi:hypothetical protein